MKGKPINEILDEAPKKGDLSFSFRCLVCDLAFSLGISESEFYDKYDMAERAQLVATYRSQMERQSAMSIASQPKKRQG